MQSTHNVRAAQSAHQLVSRPQTGTPKRFQFDVSPTLKVVGKPAITGGVQLPLPSKCENPEQQLTELMLGTQKVAEAVCRQLRPLLRSDFLLPHYGCIYGATSTLVAEHQETTVEAVTTRLKDWKLDPNQVSPLAIEQALSTLSQLRSGTLESSEQASVQMALRLANLIKQRNEERAQQKTLGFNSTVQQGLTAPRDGASSAPASVILRDGVPSFSSFLSSTQWPVAAPDMAFHGLVGEFVRVVEPHTESDKMALVAQLLVAVGNLVGRNAHCVVEDSHHHFNLYACLVGESSKGRKGTAWRRVLNLLHPLDMEWADKKVVGGLSSGEGLIHAVRDPVERLQLIRDGNKVSGQETIVADPGVVDKRLLIIEEEVAAILKNAQRDGNTLTMTLRSGWDGGILQTLTKNSAEIATNPHISLIGHVTKLELLRYLTETEKANGFANRIIWIGVRRSKILPDGGNLNDDDLQPLRKRLQDVINFSKTVGEMKRDEESRALWHKVYPYLTRDSQGLLGAVTSRAEAQVLRLSGVYALLDRSPVIRQEHLLAALAFWDYSERSAAYIFGDSSGDPVADTILVKLRSAYPSGVSQEEIQNLFSRNHKADRLHAALNVLAQHGLVVQEKEKTGQSGRPASLWIYRPHSGTTSSNDEENEENEVTNLNHFLVNFVSFVSRNRRGRDV